MRTLMVLCLLAMGAVLAAAPTASANRAPLIAGKCTVSSTSKIKAKLETAESSPSSRSIRT